MSSKLLWTPIKFTVSSSIFNCSGSSSSHIECTKNRLLSLLKMRMYWVIDLSFPALDGRHWSICIICHIIQMQNLRLFFSAGPIASSFTAEAHPLKHKLVWFNNHNTTWPLSVSLFKVSQLVIFPTLEGPLIFLAKTPLKCLVSCLLTFQHCHFKLPMGLT